MASSKSPTERCLAVLKALSFVYQKVERWNPHAMKRQDLFGIIDILAVHPGSTELNIEPQTLGVQACAGSGHAAHRTKALAEPRLRAWLSVPSNRFEIWSWAKRGPRGQRKRYELRVERITLEDLP